MQLDLVKIALAEYGTKGILGKNSNKQVLKYFRDIGFSGITDDDTAWCTAFMNWCLLQAGYKGTGKLNARSFLTYGSETKKPVLGDIVVLWRDDPNSWTGHVGLFVAMSDTSVWVLGGNQDNMVNIKAFPKSQILSFRTKPLSNIPTIQA